MALPLGLDKVIPCPCIYLCFVWIDWLTGLILWLVKGNRNQFKILRKFQNFPISFFFLMMVSCCLLKHQLDKYGWSSKLSKTFAKLLVIIFVSSNLKREMILSISNQLGIALSSNLGRYLGMTTVDEVENLLGLFH